MQEYQSLSLSRLRSDGFVSFSNIFSDTEMKKMRTQAENLFRPEFKAAMDDDNHPLYGSHRAGIFHRFPEMRWIITNKGMIEALTSIAGPNYIITPFVAHKSFYAKWHRDTDSPMKAGHNFFVPQHNRPIQIALYLQSNKENGGGLDIVPKSHFEVPIEVELEKLRHTTREDGFIAYNRARILYRFNYFRLKQMKSSKPVYKIPSHAGDVVAFDFGARHRASPDDGVPNSLDMTAKVEKIALFFSLLPDNDGARAYIEYLRNEKGAGHSRAFDNQQDMVQLAKIHGFQVP